MGAFASFGLLQITTGTIAGFASLGMLNTASRVFAGLAVGDTHADQSAKSIVLLAPILALAAVLVVLLAPDTLLNTDSSLPRLAIAVGAGALTLDVFASGAAYGLERYRQSAAVSLFVALITIACMAWAAVEKNVALAIWTLVLAAFLQAVGNVAIVVQAVGTRHFRMQVTLADPSFLPAIWREIPMSLASLMAVSGAWIVGHIMLATPDREYNFALFTVGYQWFTLCLFLPNTVSRVLLPVFVKQMRSKNSKHEMRGRMLVGVRSVLVVSIVVCAVGAIASELIASAYGTTLSIQRSYIFAFMLAAVPGSVANVFGSAIVAREDLWRTAQLQALWLISLCLSVYLLRSLGAWSAAIGYGLASVAILIASGLCALFNRQVSKIRQESASL